MDLKELKSQRAWTHKKLSNIHSGSDDGKCYGKKKSSSGVAHRKKATLVGGNPNCK